VKREMNNDERNEILKKHGYIKGSINGSCSTCGDLVAKIDIRCISCISCAIKSAVEELKIEYLGKALKRTKEFEDQIKDRVKQWDEFQEIWEDYLDNVLDIKDNWSNDEGYLG
jgi:hypothetical protein